jgi:hypothetical protein
MFRENKLGKYEDPDILIYNLNELQENWKVWA